MGEALEQIVEAFIGDLTFFNSRRSLVHEDKRYSVIQYSFDNNGSESIPQYPNVPAEFERSEVPLHPSVNFGIRGYGLEFASVDVSNNITMNMSILLYPGMKVPEMKKFYIVNRSPSDSDSIMEYLNLRYSENNVSSETRSLIIEGESIDVMIYVPNRNSDEEEVIKEIKILFGGGIGFLVDQSILCIKVPGFNKDMIDTLFPIFCMFEYVSACIPFSSGSTGVWFILKNRKKTLVPTDIRITQEYMDYISKVSSSYYDDSELRQEVITNLPLIIDPVHLSSTMKLILY